MRPATQTDLRRAVRRMVYASCRRTLDSKDAVLASDVVKQIRSELGTVEETGLEDDALRNWIDEDEDAFENAVLISELVTRNIGSVRTSAPSPAAEIRPTPTTAPHAPARKRPQSPAGIADMLDDMLSQQKQRR